MVAPLAATTEQSDKLPMQLPDWELPAWTGIFARDRQLRGYLRRFLPLIRQAERDGIPQVAPILVAFMSEPAVVRARIGKGAWKRIHHGDITLNAWRARVKLTTSLDFGLILGMRVSVLKEAKARVTRFGVTATEIAAQMVGGGTIAEFRECIGLVHDTIRMDGVVRGEWSLRRLREEHDLRSRAYARRTASETTFAPPYIAECGGFTFTRLISPADFAEESLVQKHCVASYTSAAMVGKEITFRIEGPERATVSFSAVGHIEIKRARNLAVSRECREAAKQMFHAFKASQKKPSRVTRGNIDQIGGE